MPIMTPDAKNHAGLAALASRYVEVAALPWVPTRFESASRAASWSSKSMWDS